MSARAARSPQPGSTPMDLPYLRSYPAQLQDQVRALLASGGTAALLQRKYPQAHALRTDKALYEYTAELKAQHLRKGATLQKVAYDSKIHVVRNALGLHTSRALVQGGKLSARHEIRVAAMFKNTPEEFLRMIVVHELAHLREKDHDKAFYQLCSHMEPSYHQYEFDVRLYLTHLDAGGARLWGPAPAPQ
ncbi:M48 family metallopeptidase [Comamonas endophytica]|uniref:M48 family metallopeptidase n=1 Tax=Comamonas endophytica TaxID=2949090 RepID=A0ABY6G9Y0_9BURK|nr:MULTISPECIES: M48 family metallopeptidase [unclassified Acidovorax]MCD2513932.1 M48 family metallopeptidase [Acidovorax sp. D4N7]UYG51723.1 M48 family metallopeptidase [Acidovorax sp. 5MLIR]UYG52074.1 M48 family metallopeptidase [Acidovorax sp. 5MLIR]